MKRIKLLSLIAVLALVATACGTATDTTTTTAGAVDTPTTTGAATPDTTSGDGTTDTTAPASTGSLADYGESTDADPALVQKALGPVGEVPDIVLASIARANQDLDDATIAKAMECWSAQECDTGSGGDLIMGYADGGGLNVWRQVTHMEAILQALTYPEIGTIVSTDAQWNTDPAVAAGDIRFLIQRGADFVIGYPDQGVAIADAILELGAAGIPYIPYSAGWVGLPEQDGALIPGEDYTAIVGENLCDLGESFAQIMNDEVGSGTIGILGGTPGNALSLGWEQCEIPALNDTIELVSDPADTYWVNSIALEVVTGWLSTNPDIAGFSYEYADGLYTALDAYEQLGIPLDNLVLTVRTDEQTLFCDWADRGNPNYKIFYSAGGNFQSRVAVTAAMLELAGADVPAEIDVPHIMRQVSADDCDANRVTPTVSNTSLVPNSVLALMYPEG